MKQATRAVPNPLLARDSDLVQRLGEFRVQVNDMLLDKFVAEKLNDPARRVKDGLHSLGDIKATAIVLRILTKKMWEPDDLRVLDLCWREATASELFGMEFEGERFRMQQCIAEVRPQLLANQVQ